MPTQTSITRLDAWTGIIPFMKIYFPDGKIVVRAYVLATEEIVEYEI